MLLLYHIFILLSLSNLCTNQVLTNQDVNYANKEKSNAVRLQGFPVTFTLKLIGYRSCPTQLWMVCPQWPVMRIQGAEEARPESWVRQGIRAETKYV